MNQSANTTHFARRPVLNVKSEPDTGRHPCKRPRPAGPVVAASPRHPLEERLQEGGQVCGRSYRSLAGEVLAGVGGGAAVEEGPVAEERRFGGPLGPAGEDQV